MKMKYTITGLQNDVAEVRRPGHTDTLYVEGTKYLTVGETVELSDRDVVGDGQPQEYQRLMDRYHAEIAPTQGKHTPGPWHVIHQILTDQSWDIISPGPNGICVATCGCCESENSHVGANAAFIARACNSHDELLAACKAALAVMVGTGQDTVTDRAIALVEQAIARAEGRDEE